MKTIAVLTDFSLCSERAAIYAMHLEKKIKADEILYNLEPVPVSGKLVMASGFPDDEGQDLRSEINYRLEALLIQSSALKIFHFLQTSSVP